MQTICLSDKDKITIGNSATEYAVKDLTQIQIRRIKADINRDSAQLQPTTELPSIKLITKDRQVDVQWEQQQQQTILPQTTKTVTINVYQDTNKDGKGDTPIMYDATLHNTQQQGVQLTYQTAVNSPTDLKPLVDFLEPVGKTLNNDDKTVPLGISVLDDGNKLSKIMFEIRSSGTSKLGLCNTVFEIDGNNSIIKKQDTCEISADNSRQIDQTKIHYYAFELDPSKNTKFTKGPDDIYDISVTVFDKAGNSATALPKQSLRFDQKKEQEYKLKQEQLLICLGSYDCRKWAPSETALNILPLTQPQQTESKVFVNNP